MPDYPKNRAQPQFFRRLFLAGELLDSSCPTNTLHELIGLPITLLLFDVDDFNSIDPLDPVNPFRQETVVTHDRQP